jgi:hypothetical protein
LEFVPLLRGAAIGFGMAASVPLSEDVLFGAADPFLMPDA